MNVEKRDKLYNLMKFRSYLVTSATQRDTAAGDRRHRVVVTRYRYRYSQLGGVRFEQKVGQNNTQLGQIWDF